MKIKTHPHRSLNTSKGVVRSPELSTCTIEEIKHIVEKQLVTDIKRISMKKSNQIIDTNSYILMFNSPKPPSKLKIGYIIVKVNTYIPCPLRCYNCQKFELYESWCHHCHHHVVPPARISLSFSRHPSLSSITPSRSSRLHPVSAQCCCI